MGKKQRSPSNKQKKQQVWWRLPEGYSFIPVAQAAVTVSVVLLAVIMYSNMQSSLRYLDPEDSDTLKEAFFGHQPWVIVCNNGTSIVDPTFEGVSRRMKKDLNFGVLDCGAQLASKKSTTTFKRLKLNRKQHPVIFYSAYGMSPKQLSPKFLRSEYALTRELRDLVKVHAAKVTDTKQLQQTCLGKNACAVVLSGGSLSSGAVETLNAVSDESEKMGVVWVLVDSSKLKFKKPTENGLGLSKFKEGMQRVLLFKHKEGDLLTARPYLGRFDAHLLLAFVHHETGDFVEVNRSSVSLIKRPRQAKQRSQSQEGGGQRGSSSNSRSGLKMASGEQRQEPPLLTEEERQAQEAERVERELQRRREMEEEASDFIMDGEGYDDEGDEGGEEEEYDDEDTEVFLE